jgi:hypothetical protein
VGATEEEAVSFELEIQPLFTQRDQEAMLVVFDLWEVEDVREHADAILEQLESGRMPCYERWPQERVALFRRWMEGGMAA